MTVSAYQLVVDGEGPRSPIRIAPGRHDAAVATALDMMVAEARSSFRYHLRLLMSDGSTVVARPRARR